MGQNNVNINYMDNTTTSNKNSNNYINKIIYLAQGPPSGPLLKFNFLSKLTPCGPRIIYLKFRLLVSANESNSLNSSTIGTYFRGVPCCSIFILDHSMTLQRSP